MDLGVASDVCTLVMGNHPFRAHRVLPTMGPPGKSFLKQSHHDVRLQNVP